MRFGTMTPLPTICKNLLYINIGVFALTWVLGNRDIDLISRFGLHYFNSPGFSPIQFFTYQFIHGDFMHILMNMFGLYIFGSRLERIWGEKRFLLFYLICVAGSALFVLSIQMFQVYQATGFISPLGKMEILPQAIEDIYRTVTFGASGAIMGLLTAFAMLFPNTEFIIIPFPVPIKAKYLAIGYGIIELYQGISNNVNDHVSHMGHIGGLITGFILVWYWNKTNRKTFY